MKRFWLSSNKMTVGVECDDKLIIRDGAPIIFSFRGQPLSNLENWMKTQGGFRKELIFDGDIYNEY